MTDSPGDPMDHPHGRRFYWTVREVAAELAVAPRTVRRWIADGRLAHVRVGGSRVGGSIRAPDADYRDFCAPRPRRRRRGR